MTRYRALILPLVLTLAGLAILISLGLWQLERRDWKLGLIARIEARASGEAITLRQAKQFWASEGDVEYYRLALTGRFLHEHERYLYGLVDGEAGWRVLTPLETQEGDVIFVDRGFVPEPFRKPATRIEGQIDGDVSLTALARASEKGSIFTPVSNPAANRWFLRDVQSLIASLPDDLVKRSLPFMAEAEPMPVAGGWPRAGVTRLKLSNRHVEYAITWFGLAASLVIIFIFFARKQLRNDRYARKELHDDRKADADAGIADRNSSV